MSTAVVLSKGFDFEQAVSAAQVGDVDMGVFVDWCKGELIPLEKAPVLAALCPKDFGDILKAQSELIAVKAAAGAAKGGGRIFAKIGKRGGVSLYGVNTRMPVTLFAEQWAKVIAYLADAKSDIHTVLSDPNASSVFEIAKDFTQGNDPDFLAEVRAGKHPHAKVVGDKVHVKLSRKAE